MMPMATPHLGPLASTRIPAGRPHAYIPRLPKVPYTREICFRRDTHCVRTIRLLWVDDSLSRRANWGAHAEYAYWTEGLASSSEAVVGTHIRATRKCNECSCGDRHETSILSDPMEFHDDRSQVLSHRTTPRSRPHRIGCKNG